MRILIYGINFAPELTGTGKYTGEMAKWLASQAHDIRVVTAPPYYPEWQIKDCYSGWKYFVEETEGTRVYRCPLWVPRQPRTLSRLLHLFSFVLSSFPVLLGQIVWRPKVMLVVAPTILCVPGAWLAARLTGATAWLHVQDFEVDVAQGLDQVKAGPLQKLALAVERFWLRRFDRVSTISARMLDRLGVKGVDAERRVLFPNWVDTDVIRPIQGPNPFRAKLGIPDSSLVALYAGNMGEKQGLDIIIDSASMLSDTQQDLKFVLAGAGAARARLEQKAEKLSNIRWLPLQPDDRLNELLNLADIHLLPQRSGASDLVMPSKLTGMLASGRPVVATAAEGTQVAEIVSCCGLVVQPESVSGLTDAILALAENANLREELGQAARKYACENLTKEIVLEEFYKNVLVMTEDTIRGH